MPLPQHDPPHFSVSSLNPGHCDGAWKLWPAITLQQGDTSGVGVEQGTQGCRQQPSWAIGHTACAAAARR